MMKVKCLFCILLSLVLLMSLLSAAAFADNEEENIVPPAEEMLYMPGAEGPDEMEPLLPETYTVTFDYGGLRENIEQIVPVNEKIVSMPEDPEVPEGYIFDGWFIVYEDGSREEWKFDDDTVVEDIVLYAFWSEIEEDISEYYEDDLSSQSDPNTPDVSGPENLPDIDEDEQTPGEQGVLGGQGEIPGGTEHTGLITDQPAAPVGERTEGLTGTEYTAGSERRLITESDEESPGSAAPGSETFGSAASGSETSGLASSVSTDPGTALPTQALLNSDKNEKTNPDGNGATEAIKSEEHEKKEKDEKTGNPQEIVDSEEKSNQESDSEYPEFSKIWRENGIVITVSAPKGVFPKGATLQVTSIPGELVEDVIEEERSEDVNVAASYSFDIKVVDQNGEEVQPADNQKVTVTFRLAEVKDENLDTTVYHISEEENNTQTVEQLDVETKGQTAIVETEGFSIYTVEFTYQKLEYAFHMDSSVSSKTANLSDILLTVGLINTTTDVKNVSAVNSDNSALTASKVASSGDWTITVNNTLQSATLTVTISGVEYVIEVNLDTTGKAWSLIGGIPPVTPSRSVYIGGIKWKIIGDGGNKWLVISNEILKKDINWDYAKKYGAEEVYDKSLSEIERKLVIATSKQDSPYTYQPAGTAITFSAADLENNTKVFLLSAEEARTYCAAEGVDCPSTWWVRSGVGNDEAGAVATYAALWKYEKNNTMGARPAFQLDLSSVVFTSDATKSKSTEQAGNGKFGTILKSDTDIKLTVLDSGYNAIKVKSPSGSTEKTRVFPGGTLRIYFENAGTGDKEYVSALICQGEEIKYYASLKTNNSTGTWDMTLPALISGEDYTLKIFCEKQDGTIDNVRTDVVGPVLAFPLEVGYAITYVLNGGSWPEGVSPAEGYTSADLPLSLKTPARSGFSFEGWYDNKDFSGAKVTEIPLGTTGDKTYYAKWQETPITYTVTFDANGQGTAPGPQTIQEGTTASRPTDPAATGYVFKGWYTDKECKLIL